MSAARSAPPPAAEARAVVWRPAPRTGGAGAYTVGRWHLLPPTPSTAPLSSSSSTGWTAAGRRPRPDGSWSTSRPRAPGETPGLSTCASRGARWQVSGFASCCSTPPRRWGAGPWRCCSPRRVARRWSRSSRPHSRPAATWSSSGSTRRPSPTRAAGPRRRRLTGSRTRSCSGCCTAGPGSRAPRSRSCSTFRPPMPSRAPWRARWGDDRFESRGLEFQESVARAMRAYVERVEHAVIVDGTGTEDEVARRVLEAALPAEVRRA